MIRTVDDTSLLTDERFDIATLAHFESVMAQGNGYLGLRAAHEEDYPGSIRGFYIAGSYNKDSPYESAELPNLPDLLHMRLILDGECFRMDEGTLLRYRRSLHLHQGELVRDLDWRSPNGREYRICFRRFVSRDNLHLIASRVEVTSLSGDCTLEVVSGVDGRMTNSGTQNLHELQKRVFDNRYLCYRAITTQSDCKIEIGCMFVVQQPHKIWFTSERRRLLGHIRLTLKKGVPICVEKRSIVSTGLDLQPVDPLEQLRQLEQRDYDRLFADSRRVWAQSARIEIESTNNFDQLAINFALYHLACMTPAHDNRCSIAAKGLTGEGYKGHVFWDTEIFLLPHHLYTSPDIAKGLLTYRYRNLDGARAKARQTGYDGALFPWESAFTGEEETPLKAAMNIRTGECEPIHSAAKEHHISADVGYAILQYEHATQDESFMREMGLEMLCEISAFWISRADKSRKPYTILDVIGPDEYTEHIDNNAYTNHLAHYVVSQTIDRVRRYSYPCDTTQMEDFVAHLYLPQPTDAHLLPQDDSFLSKLVIDLTPYRARAGAQSILLDYTRTEVVNMQILKQADAVMLLYLFPDLFDPQTVRTTFAYYEPKTIHDSSLSQAIHSIVGLRCGETQRAYAHFEKAARIDLGTRTASADGVHAASLGALYLSVVFGFGGLLITEDGFDVNPQLPQAWRRLKFPFAFRGERYLVDIHGTQFHIEREAGKPCTTN